jgi:hypothetical protein
VRQPVHEAARDARPFPGAVRRGGDRDRIGQPGRGIGAGIGAVRDEQHVRVESARLAALTRVDQTWSGDGARPSTTTTPHADPPPRAR